MMRVMALRSLWQASLAGLLAAACTVSAPPAATTLAAAGAGTDAVAATDSPDSAAAVALAAAEAAPGDSALGVAAARALFAAADHRLQRAIGDWLTQHPEAPLADVLLADDQVGDDVRKQIVSLCTQGLELAQRAASQPGSAAAGLQVALNLSLLAWANGATRSLLAGYGPKLAKAIDAAVAADATIEGAGPLRLQGRFRSKAPWPYGDRALAVRSLQRACELHPIAIHWLFLGDALWGRELADEARSAWRQATTAGDDDSTRAVGDLLRQQAMARLRARP
jgi:hypothetical protein